MKTDKILYSFFVACLLLLGACAEDNGNYDYTQINEVTIDSIPTEKTCEAGGQLYIKPDIKSLDEAVADLSYSWSIENKEVSTDKVLDIALPPLDYKRHLAALTVTDNVTKMQYRRTFYLNVVSPFNWGYYFLTRKDDGFTEMAYIQAQPEDNSTLEDVKYVTGCGDYGFGNEPLQLVGSFCQETGQKYYWIIAVVTKEGDYPVIVTNNNTFMATTLITEESFSDPTYRFKPEQGISSMMKNKEIFFVGDGKFAKFVNNNGVGILYRPAIHDKEYYWSKPCLAGNGGNFCWIYDELTHKYYVIKPISNTNPAYDVVVEIENNVEIKGEFINAFSGYGRPTFYAYTFNTDGIHAYEYNFASSIYSFKGETIIPVPGLNKKPVLVPGIRGFAANQWYINNGNVIHSSPIMSPQLSVWKELPSDLGLGTIEFIGFSVRGSRMVVVLYDENSPEERKGSVIFIDVETKEITHTFPHILHHCVDYGAFNTTTSPFIGDDGDMK